MDLFNEYYNCEVQCLLNLYSLNRAFSAEEAAAWAREAHVYSLSDTYADVLRRWERQGLLCSHEGAFTVADTISSFAAPLNALETERLSELCRKDAATLFLPDTLLDTLRRVLPPVSESPTDAGADFGLAGGNQLKQFPNPETFQTILRAISEKKKIGYHYQADGQSRYAEVSPWRLEYDAFDGRWWLISFWAAQDRTVKSRLENLRTVRLLEQAAAGEDEIRRAVKRHLAPDPVVLRIAGENAGKLRNVVERCFIGLESMLEITAAKRSETEYELSFRYFRWDKNLIIRKLMALGDYVTIIAPEDMVRLMVNELRTALNRYNCPVDRDGP